MDIDGTGKNNKQEAEEQAFGTHHVCIDHDANITNPIFLHS